MKIEHLAVIFVLIILPIDIVLGLYLDAQMNTIRNQAVYDSRLVDCVYDAMKIYQSNSIVDTENDVVTSKMENIEASASTFLSSLQSSFGLSGYKASVMQEYVPAVVYTMYDGYYIYSKFNNSLSQKQIDTSIKNSYYDNVTYEGIKSYVFYSCRYQRNMSSSNYDDFVITYSLDNYITIQGIIHGNYVEGSGYLIDGITENADGSYTYDGVTFKADVTEDNKEFYGADFSKDEFSYTKINGTKYYLDEDNEEIFHIIDGVKSSQVKKAKEHDKYSVYEKAIKENKDAYLYYKEAYEFTNRVKDSFSKHTETDAEGNNKTIVDSYGLSDLSSANAVYSENGSVQHIKDFGNHKIFEKGTGTEYIQDSDSAFNQHRKAVIRYTVETNLSAAIAGFSAYSDKIEFAMPKLSEEDWETVENNVCVIGFLQGLDIGTKKYNGYAVVANTLTGEYVDENSIYLISGNQYHRANAEDISGTNIEGVYNMDFERHYKKETDENGSDTITYYFPKLYHDDDSPYKLYTGSYTSIVAQTKVNTKFDDMYKYMRTLGTDDYEIKKAYYTALARERYGSYKISHDVSFGYYLKNY